MADDININLYDVVAEAESYFANIDKTKKSSGWKSYQRWLFENEPKYFPSGVRNNIKPHFVSEEFKDFLIKNPKSYKLDSNSGWKELGPYYIEEVTGHYAVGLGRIETFYIDPNNEDIIFLGSRSGGFWKTLDGGVNWENTTDFLFASGVNTMAVSPDNPNRVLINVRNSYNGTTHGIFESLDGGSTWNITSFNPENLNWGGLGTNNRIYKIMYHPTISDLVFIGTSEGLFRSDNNFETFSFIPTGNPWEYNQNYNYIEFHPTDENIIYTSTFNNDSQIYVSYDAGQSFIQSGTIPGNSSNIQLSVSAACENCVFVGSSDGVWKSDDLGQSFSLVGDPEISNYGAFAVSDVDPNIMLFGDIDTHMSSDGGQTWNQVTYWATGNANYNTTGQYVHADIRGARSFNGVFWVNTDGLLAKSIDNGLTWEIFEGQSIRENYCLGVSQSNHFRSITGSQDNGTSIKNENNWIEFYGADGMEGIIHPLNDDWMIGSLQFGGKRRTKDGGYSQDGVNPDDFNGDWVTPLMYDPKNQMSIYTMTDILYKSNDFGSTWNTLGDSYFGGNIQNAAIAENNSNTLAISNYNILKLSYDGGLTFNEVSQQLPNQFITDIAFDPNDDNTIIVTYGTYGNDNNKVYISNNQGITWENITYNLGNMPIRTVVVDHTENSTIYLGAEIGVFQKAMDEESWQLYNENLPNTTVMELEVIYGSNTLRATSWGRGMWEYPLVGRENYPSILTTRISNQPTDNQPKQGIDQFVTSTIEYNDGDLTDVYVEWSTVSSTQTIQMSNTEQNIWISDYPIPNFEAGTKVFFKVFAGSEQVGVFSETYEFMYEVRENVLCTPSMNCSVGDGFQLFQLQGIDNTSGCEGYGDFTSQSTELEQGQEYQLTITTGWGDQYIKVWIDYNDDLDFTENEVIINNYVIAPGLGAGTYTDIINFTLPQTAELGQHILRAKANWSGDVPDDPCVETSYGETEDYSVVIVESALGLVDNTFQLKPILYPNPSDGIVSLDLRSNYNDVTIQLNDILGRQVMNRNYSEGKVFNLNITEEPGVYFLSVYAENRKVVFKLIIN